MIQNSEWPLLQPDVALSPQSKNPFWNKLSGSNPFLDDIVHSSTDKHISNITNVQQGSEKHLDTNNHEWAVTWTKIVSNLSSVFSLSDIFV